MTSAVPQQADRRLGSGLWRRRSKLFRRPNYGWSDLRGDLFGGVTTAVVALPLALALGVAVGVASGSGAGEGALAGLYSAIAVGFFTAVFGGTPGQISGPTAPMAVAMTVVVLQHSLSEAFVVVMFAGVLQMVLGMLRIGRFISYTPYSVISGFMSGIGVIIMALQVLPFLGADIASGKLPALIAQWPDAIAAIDVQAFGIAMVTLFVAIAWPRRLRQIFPPTLAALIIGALLGFLWLSDAPTISEVPSGLPNIVWPDLSGDFLLSAISSAFILALLGSIDSLLTSLVADSLTRKNHNPNRELVGQGLGNAVSGLIGGLPGAGTTLTTVVNIRAGGRTAISGIVVAGLLLALLLGAGSITEPIPHAVLAGILMKVGWEIIDWRFITRIRQVQRSHLSVMLLTLVLTLFVDLVTAVALGLIVAGMANAVRSERLELDNVLSVPLLGGDPDDPYLAPVGLVALRGRFSVASSNALTRVISADIEEHEVVIFDFSRTTAMDDSAAVVLKQLIESATEQGTPSIVMGLYDNSSVADALESLGALDDVPKNHRVESLIEARELADRLWQEMSASTEDSEPEPKHEELT
jgi:SulP family sulfate permease